MTACKAEHGLHGVGQCAYASGLEMHAVIGCRIIIFLQEPYYFTAAKKHRSRAEYSISFIADTIFTTQFLGHRVVARCFALDEEESGADYADIPGGRYGLECSVEIFLGSDER